MRMGRLGHPNPNTSQGKTAKGFGKSRQIRKCDKELNSLLLLESCCEDAENKNADVLRQLSVKISRGYVCLERLLWFLSPRDVFWRAGLFHLLFSEEIRIPEAAQNSNLCNWGFSHWLLSLPRQLLLELWRRKPSRIRVQTLQVAAAAAVWWQWQELPLLKFTDELSRCRGVCTELQHTTCLENALQFWSIMCP